MTDKVMFSSNSDEYETPPWLFEKLDKAFDFSLDAAASPENYKCNIYYTENFSGLIGSWERYVVFCNPPYSKRGLQSQAADWCAKAARGNHIMCAMLLPARTDTQLWHDYVFPSATEILFIKGRLKFLVDGTEMPTSAPFPSAIVLFKGSGTSKMARFPSDFEDIGTIVRMQKKSRSIWTWFHGKKEKEN